MPDMPAPTIITSKCSGFLDALIGRAYSMAKVKHNRSAAAVKLSFEMCLMRTHTPV